MHSAALHLAPILAEKSRTPFFIAGGVLAGWAVFVSIALGLRMPQFPGGLRGQRIVMAISAVLVLGATSTAVLTSSSPAKESASATAAGASSASAGAPPPGAPPPAGATGAQTGGPSPSTTSQPAATATGTAAPAPAAPATPAVHTSLKLAAAPSALAFDTKQLSAKAGTVTITFANSSPLEHNVAVAQGNAVLGSTPTFAGGAKTLTLTLKAGTYTFYCTVPGHRQGGMEGTLTVS